MKRTAGRDRGHWYIDVRNLLALQIAEHKAASPQMFYAQQVLTAVSITAVTIG